MVLLGFVVGAVGGGMFWNKKRKEIPVVALHKVRGFLKIYLNIRAIHLGYLKNTVFNFEFSLQANPIL